MTEKIMTVFLSLSIRMATRELSAADKRLLGVEHTLQTMSLVELGS